MGGRWKKTKADTRWKPLGSCPHPCIKTYYAANFSATVLTNTTSEQWPLRTDFDKSPLEFSAHSPDSWTFTGIYPPLNAGSRTVREYFHFSPQMGTVCDSHISACQNASPEHRALTQNKYLTSQPPPPHSRKSDLHNWWAATDTCSSVLQRNPWFEIKMQKGFYWHKKQVLRVITQLHLFASHVSSVFSSLISSSAVSLQIETICLLCSIFNILNPQLKLQWMQHN